MEEHEAVEMSEKLKDIMYQVMKIFEENEIDAAEMTLVLGLMFKIHCIIIGRNSLEASLDLYETVFHSTGFHLKNDN